MHDTNQQQRFHEAIRRDRWRNVILPTLQGVAIVVAVSPLVYLKVTLPLKSIAHREVRPQITPVKTVLPLPNNAVGTYRYAGTVRVAGGTVTGYSLTPLHVGESVAVVYRRNRYVMEPISGYIQERKP